MTSQPDSRRPNDKKRNPRTALDPLLAGALASVDTGPSRMEIVGRAILAPFSHRRNESNSILADLAPVIMTPRMMNAAATVSAQSRSAIDSRAANPRMVDFATLGRAPARLGLGSRRLTSRDLQIAEASDELLAAEVPDPEGVASTVSFLKGFNATIPSAEQGRSRRRQTRNVDAPRLGLKKREQKARGLLGDDEGSVISEEDAVLVNGRRGLKPKRGRQSLAAGKTLGKAELKRQTSEIMNDKENINVRRTLINNEIAEITQKIQVLDSLRDQLEQDLLKLHEEDLELDDELEGVKERIEIEEVTSRPQSAVPISRQAIPSSRRRRGPAFLPSEHDELPPGMAFMTIAEVAPVVALDFSEPYGTLVSASSDEASPRVWDLLSGEQLGQLRGHTRGGVKCLQVEDTLCLTGGVDGAVRLWDLRRVGMEEDEIEPGWDLAEEKSEFGEFGEFGETRSSRSEVSAGSDANGHGSKKESTCIRVLEGHSRPVTALYFEDNCLVTGASDKTLRQWDMTTGQCVMTMDILWALSHPPSAATSFSAMATPAFSDGSWDMYDDFVGGVQSWGYALVSGSGDGAVRMWDMRTGQSHRTLQGHTAPVTCVQFDEHHIISGSLDKSIRVWDVRTGGAFDTMRYDHPVTALQFDSRKIIAATGENGVKIYNRTSMQHSTLLTNGHTSPVERLRYIDRYLVTGGRDSMLKIWAL